MARGFPLRSNFTRGELDPLLFARRDLQAYQSGLSKARNVLIQPQGGVKRRPGLKHLDILPPLLEEINLSTVTVTAPEGGLPGNAHDDNEASFTIGGAIGVIDPYVLLHIDLLAQMHIWFADCRLLSVSAGSTAEFRWQYSTDDITYTDAMVFDSVSTTAITRRARIDSTVRYLRLAKVGGTDMTTATAQVAEVDIFRQSQALNDNLFGLEFGEEFN